MAALEWIRFLAGGFLLLFGLVIFFIEMVGVFRFKYVLNRMHAAAMGDTLGIGFSLIGLILMSGFTFTSLKLFLVIVFLWFSSPASSHLIARLEVATDEEPEKHYKRLTIGELEHDLAQRAEAEAREAEAARRAEAEAQVAEAAQRAETEAQAAKTAQRAETEARAAETLQRAGAEAHAAKTAQRSEKGEA